MGGEKLDYPVGISAFFCPEKPPIYSSSNDYEKSLDMLHKIESLRIPDSVMDAVFSLANLKAMTPLCVGDKSHSTIR
jgi:hypothetical protein